MHVPSKTYSSDYNSISNYMHTLSRTGLEPWLTVRKSIISPILLPTLLQIYCIGLIGPISISYFFLGLGCNLWPYNSILAFITFLMRMLLGYCTQSRPRDAGTSSVVLLVLFTNTKELITYFGFRILICFALS